MDQPKRLISVLRDPTARVDERDDAAMDLAAYDEREVEDALLEVAMSSSCDDLIKESCGESLAEIWLRRKEFNSARFAQLPKPARREAIALIRARRPQWLSEIK